MGGESQHVGDLVEAVFAAAHHLGRTVQAVDQDEAVQGDARQRLNLRFHFPVSIHSVQGIIYPAERLFNFLRSDEGKAQSRRNRRLCQEMFVE